MGARLPAKNLPGRRDLYRWIAPIYDPMVGTFLRPVRNDVRRIAAVLDPGRILDIACGTGEQAGMLADDGFKVAGLDLSPAMLARARKKSIGKTSFFLGNAEDLPFSSGAFDCVLIMLALHEIEYQSAIRMMNEALRVLSPGGNLIVFDYVRERDLLSRISLGLLHTVERMAGRRHFRNFKFFVRHGGLEAFVRKFPLEILFATRYFRGAIGLAVLEKKG